MVTTRQRRPVARRQPASDEQESIAEEKDRESYVTPPPPRRSARNRHSKDLSKGARASADTGARVGLVSMLKGHVLDNDDVDNTCVDTKQLHLLALVPHLLRVRKEWSAVL